LKPSRGHLLRGSVHSIRERLDKLAGGPRRCGLIGDVDGDEIATVMPKDDEGAEREVGQRGEEKEVHSD